MKRFIIKISDNELDALTSLPISGFLKEVIKDCKVFFITANHLQIFINTSEAVDGCFDGETVLEELTNSSTEAVIFLVKDKQIVKACKEAGVSLRICEKTSVTDRINYSKRVALKEEFQHTAFKNIALVKEGLELEYDEITWEDLQRWSGIVNSNSPRTQFRGVLKKTQFNILLYPYMKGTKFIYPLPNYVEMIEKLPAHSFNIVIAGTTEEGETIRQYLPELLRLPNVKDRTNLNHWTEVQALVEHADITMTFNSPVAHLSSLLNRPTICLTSPIQKMKQPYGNTVKIFSEEKKCVDCYKKKGCECMQTTTVEQLVTYLTELQSMK